MRPAARLVRRCYRLSLLSPLFSSYTYIYTAPLLYSYSINSVPHHVPHTLHVTYSLLLGSDADQVGVPKLRELESRAVCEAKLGQLKEWLQYCRRHHKICSLEHIKQLIGPSTMPKRLIDLGPPDVALAAPKIINTKGRQEQYVALVLR
jgi:hypothetical protein